tara:strand:+ start:25720 stop:26715 length:996 start_codon:yes stop_codon:yes gene_type:complete
MPLISDAVQIWRAAEGDYHIEWAASHPDTQVRVDPLGGHGQVQAHYEEAAPRARIAGLPAARRHQFRLSDQHGNEVLAMERKLGMQGTPNFRDFGGYRGAGGRRVRWGYLYRSGQLSGLTPQDLELLDSLQLDLVCDFRREDEQQSSPSRYPEARQPQVASLPITPGSNAAAFTEGRLDLGGRQPMFDFMVEINRDFVESQGPIYARMFREILQRQDTRFLVHCAAGKDRTGFAVAVILLALGVSVEQVMEDYMLTARFYHPQQEVDRLRAKYGLESVPEEAILPMLEVHEAYLARALEAIRDYGAVETYLEEVLGVGSAEREELRRRYLE